jgi:alpha-tubulin suppressor-like RCC1 family protein
LKNAWSTCVFVLVSGTACEFVIGIEETTSRRPPSEGDLGPDVALGEKHGCAISNAHLYCWGSNEFGQLGVGGTDPSGRPLAVSVDVSWRGVAAGAHHSCARDDRGKVWCWGLNDRGQLGTGDRESRAVPTLVPLPARASVVSTDFSHTCALLVDSTLHCWGKNDEGELGQNDELTGDELSVDALLPVAVPGEFRAVETGQGHTCAIELDGALYCWGRNTENELGDVEGLQIRLPTRVGSDKDWLAVEAGQDHTCGLRNDFSAHCWGFNTAIDDLEGAPLGIADATLVTTPTRLDTDAHFALLRTDTFHACAIARDRSLYCWGRNVEGQLGIGHRGLRQTPVRVGYGYRSVAVGRFSTCVIAEEGGVSCTGANDEGQLGVGNTEEHERLTPVAFD